MVTSTGVVDDVSLAAKHQILRQKHDEVVSSFMPRVVSSIPSRRLECATRLPKFASAIVEDSVFLMLWIDREFEKPRDRELYNLDRR